MVVISGNVPCQLKWDLLRWKMIVFSLHSWDLGS